MTGLAICTNTIHGHLACSSKQVRGGNDRLCFISGEVRLREAFREVLRENAGCTSSPAPTHPRSQVYDSLSPSLLWPLGSCCCYAAPGERLVWVKHTVGHSQVPQALHRSRPPPSYGCLCGEICPKAAFCPGDLTHPRPEQWHSSFPLSAQKVCRWRSEPLPKAPAAKTCLPGTCD